MKKLICLAVLALVLVGCGPSDNRQEYVQCHSQIDGSVVNSSIQDYWYKEPKAENFSSGWGGVEGLAFTFQPRTGDECHIQKVPGQVN